MNIQTDPLSLFSGSRRSAVTIHPVTSETLDEVLQELGGHGRHWCEAHGFKPSKGKILIVPGEDGTLQAVLAGMGEGKGDPFELGKLARSLPKGLYTFADGVDDPAARLAWAMGGYDFDRYRKPKNHGARLAGRPDARTLRIAQGVFLTRDLINTPANDMGPDALEEAFRALAKDHGARVTMVKGDALLKKNFPMVHAVGRASTQAPRVLDLVWGKPSNRKVTLVGKGVTFDTGGLNIKPGSSMALMKKDMGGAANVMGLAHMIMAAKLPVRLRSIVGAVENAISGNAFRPGDILPSRKGISVEIGNTDAEGRLVLGDCLAWADEEEPELLIDMATLTGAARVALGPDLPPFYTHDDELASSLSKAADDVRDPLWRLPLWKPYQSMLSSQVADVNHITSGGFAGSITAALFLSRFVGEKTRWAHFDIFGWVPNEKPWARVGGEAQGIRALYEIIEDKRF